MINKALNYKNYEKFAGRPAKVDIFLLASNPLLKINQSTSRIRCAIFKRAEKVKHQPQVKKNG